MPRPSPVTDAVRSLFESGDRHSWSLTELHESAIERLGDADYSTVFRAVTAMERDGLLVRIEVGDGKARYERREEHHDHVRCNSCGKVEEVPGCSLREAEVAAQSSTGFAIAGHQLTFTGLCPECAAG